MASRSERAAMRQEVRRQADRELLDSALAPYLRDHRYGDGVLDLSAAEAEPRREVDAAPVMVTLKVAAGATIDLLRSPSRSTVVRVHRRPVAALR